MISDLREIDALVAEKVMGFKWYVPPGPFPLWNYEIRRVLSHMGSDTSLRPDFVEWNGDESIQRFGDWDRDIPKYSTNIAAAWTVFETLLVGYETVRLENWYVLLGKREYSASIIEGARGLEVPEDVKNGTCFDAKVLYESRATTAAMSICLLALLTKDIHLLDPAEMK